MSAVLTAYAKDPVGFARDLLGLQLHPKQAEILEALVPHNRVAAPTCYAGGGTYTAAVAVLWWVSTRRRALALTFSPTERQASGLLWRVIRRLHRLSGGFLPAMPERGMLWNPEDGDQMALGLYNYRHQESRLVWLSALEFIFGGRPNVLVVEDSTSGHHTELPYDVPLGPGDRHLKIGRLSTWHTVTVTAKEVASSATPGLASQEWMDRLADTHGEESEFYRSAVYGLRPSKATKESPLDWLRK